MQGVGCAGSFGILLTMILIPLPHVVQPASLAAGKGQEVDLALLPWPGHEE